MAADEGCDSAPTHTEVIDDMACIKLHSRGVAFVVRSLHFYM